MNRRRIIAVALAAMLLAVPLAACGGDDDDANGAGSPVDANDGESSSDPTVAIEGNGDVGVGDAPDPGAAVLEVDGQTFRGELHLCDLTETDGETIAFLIGATLEANGEQIEFGANGGRPAGGRNWTAQSAMTIDGSVAYMSGNGDATVDGNTVVYTGTYSNVADSQAGNGQGRFAATCSE